MRLLHFAPPGGAPARPFAGPALAFGLALVSLLLTFSACGPRETVRTTTRSPPELDPGDATFGLGLLFDDGGASGDELALGIGIPVAAVDDVAIDDVAVPDSAIQDVVPNDGAATEADAVVPVGPPFDSGAGGSCPGPLVAGDLVIDEMMIQSVAGTGDYGEWLEVRSTRDCALDLHGLRGQAPNGAKVRTFDVVGHAWLPARGTFVVADSVNPALNHALPGTVLAWAGRAGDVLRNKGGTVSLLLNDVVIDSLTFPALAPPIGASVSFPSDCPLDRRLDWTAWQFSTSSWFPGFEGTPNAPNVDVLCP
ncbi:MAG: hypothetical protein M3O36_19505 [Myxococcota bacterium]|nr:hypothetical protein [Myxococcota bacterium]